MTDEIHHQYLSFVVAGEEYAVPILQVREIIEYAPVTRVPAMPPAIRGVTNLRGRVVPVIDLAVRLGLPETALTRWTCIVVVEAAGAARGEAQVVGLLADRVSQVLDLPPSQVQPAPSFGTRIRADYLQGMGQLDGRFALLLDLGRLLSESELLAAASAAAAPREEPERPAAPDAGAEAGAAAAAAAAAAPPAPPSTSEPGP